MWVTREHHVDSPHPCGLQEAHGGPLPRPRGAWPLGERDLPPTAARPRLVAAGTELAGPALGSVTCHLGTVQLTLTSVGKPWNCGLGPGESNKTVFPAAGKTNPVKSCALKVVHQPDRGAGPRGFVRGYPGGLGVFLDEPRFERWAE